MEKRIIAIGGGDMKEKTTLKIDEYIAGLANGDHMLILIKHLKRQIHWRYALAFFFGEEHLNFVAVLYLGAHMHIFAVQENPTVFHAFDQRYRKVKPTF